jgi:hypothetical protein
MPGFPHHCSLLHLVDDRFMLVHDHELVGVPDHAWVPVDGSPCFAFGKGLADVGFETVPGDVGQQG